MYIDDGGRIVFDTSTEEETVQTRTDCLFPIAVHLGNQESARRSEDHRLRIKEITERFEAGTEAIFFETPGPSPSARSGCRTTSHSRGTQVPIIVGEQGMTTRALQ